jgi:hypothetical protein
MDNFLLVLFAILGSLLALISTILPIKAIKENKRNMFFWIIPVLFELVVIYSIYAKRLFPYSFMGLIGLILMIISIIAKKEGKKNSTNNCRDNE